MVVDNSVRTSILFLAAVTLVSVLHFTRDIVTPFALAIFFWLIIDAFARFLDGLSSKFPYWLALAVAMLTVVVTLIGIVFIVADTAIDIGSQKAEYTARLNQIFLWLDGIASKVAGFFGAVDFTIFRLLDDVDPAEKITQMLLGIGGSVKSFGSNFALIALYVAFLFGAQSSFPKKMDDLFPDVERRLQAQKVGERMRSSIEKYIGVQTIISLMQTVVSYIAMVALGLDNALFWALIIFILNYIPIVGGLAAIVLPVLFALVQFTSLTPVFILAAALFGAQFIIGNTIQPKMMGDSMNLSALVVVLSLTLWAALWGGVGAFLSAPLTVIIMIILAQFPTTRWIAVLLSADGEPELDEEEKKQKHVIPSM